MPLLQGRGQNTHAYTHSVADGHRVYLNLETKKFYCLPDLYEIIDPSLSDIIYVLNPTFTPQMIKVMESASKVINCTWISFFLELLLKMF